MVQIQHLSSNPLHKHIYIANIYTMTPIVFTAHEEALWLSIQAGTTFFGDGSTTCIIRGNVLRHFYVDLERLNKITAAGIHLDGSSRENTKIIIVADDGIMIDLENLSSADANPLPTLLIKRCHIISPLSIKGSHFAALSIDECEIIKINADHVQIDNYLSLRHLRPYSHDTNKQSQIRLVGARIDGRIDLRG